MYCPSTRTGSSNSNMLQAQLNKCYKCVVVTPHAQHEWGKVISVGVHIYIYIYVCGPKLFFEIVL